MKQTITKGLVLCALVLLCFFCMGCVEPGPLYGTWADNRGNTLSFFDDNTFMGRLAFTSGSVSPEGNYSVLLNVLTFSCNDGSRIVTEWDIRGNILYLVWPGKTAEEPPLNLTLFKVSN